MSCSEIGSPHCIADVLTAAAVGAIRRCELRQNDRRLAAVPERRGYRGGSRVRRQVSESSGGLGVKQVAHECFTVHHLRYLRYDRKRKLAQREGWGGGTRY